MIAITTELPIAPHAARPPKPLSMEDAVDIWIARWLRVPRRVLCQRYDCDPRRLYEIWEQTKFAGSHPMAVEAFRQRYPTLVDRIDYGPHRRVPKAPPADQLPLFEEPPPRRPISSLMGTKTEPRLDSSIVSCHVLPTFPTPGTP
ncbi:MAG: hypothetical protein ACOYLQ_09190 [Hyphomicrobiaceae bacterium]